jgi:membrane fusion protein (multidrug efflux system)
MIAVATIVSHAAPRRRLIGALALALVAATAAAGCKGKQVAEAAVVETPAIAVPLVAAVAKPTAQTLLISGSVEADDSSDVTADAAGKVIALMVDDGDRVKKGDPLMRLDTRNAALSSKEVKANVEAARIQQKLADEECARAKALLERGAITQAEFDRAQASCTAAAQQVAAIVARQSMVGKQMSDGVVRAPFDGVITRKQVALGEWVAPGMPLLAVVDDDPLLAVLSVPESDISKIVVGQEVAVASVAFEGKTFAATVSKIDTEIGRTRGLRVETTLAPGSGLRPGMFISATVNVGKLDLPAVPATAVVRRGRTWRTFVAVSGHLEERVVQLGTPPGPGMVSIAKGVKIGESVAQTITDQTLDGVRIQ